MDPDSQRERALAAEALARRQSNRQRSSRLLTILALIAVFLVVAAVGAFFLQRHDWTEPTPEAPATSPPEAPASTPPPSPTDSPSPTQDTPGGTDGSLPLSAASPAPDSTDAAELRRARELIKADTPASLQEAISILEGIPDRPKESMTDLEAARLRLQQLKIRQNL